MSVFTSPYNSPQAQWKRLNGLRADYTKAKAAVKFDWEHVLGFAFWLFVGSLVVTLFGAPAWLGYLLLLGMPIAPVYYAGRRIFKDPAYPHDPLTCPYCKQMMPVTSPWTCGHCGTQNAGNFHEPSKRTFAEKCIRCDLTPSAIACRKCSKAIIFSEMEYKQCPDEIAYITGYPPAEPGSVTDPLAERLAARRKRLRIE
jgi:hypothetical protein